MSVTFFIFYLFVFCLYLLYCEINSLFIFIMTITSVLYEMTKAL